MACDPTTTEVLDALSSPLPTDARSVSRRRFLQGAAVGTGLTLMPGWLTAAAAAAPLGPHDGVLVVIMMPGGNDGLNMVVPTGTGAYYDRRGDIAITPAQALPIADGRGFHPALGALQTLWNQGSVAVIDGVGIPGLTDLSHFSMLARWMGGTTGSSIQSGWVGRYLDGLAGGDDPLHAVAIGDSVPLLMQGQVRRATGLPATNNGIFALSALDPIEQRQLDVLSALAAAPSGMGTLADAVAGLYPRSIDVARAIEPSYAEGLPDGDLTRQLELCARLINANLGIRVLSVLYGDFDGHANLRPMHDARMADLNQALIAFYRRLHPDYAARTLLLTVSEFGRRVQANHSAGADHGAASTLLAISPQVNGGFYGQMPSLTQLDSEGNLVPSVDYRSVYATVLDTWLGADSQQVLGGGFGNLGFVAAPAPARTTSGLDPAITSATFAYRAQIVRLYLAYFDRLPDSAGLQFWTDARRRGVSLASVSDGFASSQEFRNRYGAVSNPDFVTGLYQRLLGRSPDPGGLAFWVGLLNGGTPKGRVVLGFSEAPEYVKATAAQVDQVNHQGPVTRLYKAYFLRNPDESGLRYWIDTGLPLTAVSNAFADSAEFSMRYGALSNGGFVDQVYANVLGRAPDPGGRAYWLGQLAAGLSRGQLMLWFSESAEFVARTGTLP